MPLLNEIMERSWARRCRRDAPCAAFAARLIDTAGPASARTSPLTNAAIKRRVNPRRATIRYKTGSLIYQIIHSPYPPADPSAVPRCLHGIAVHALTFGPPCIRCRHHPYGRMHSCATASCTRAFAMASPASGSRRWCTWPWHRQSVHHRDRWRVPHGGRPALVGPGVHKRFLGGGNALVASTSAPRTRHYVGVCAGPGRHGGVDA